MRGVADAEQPRKTPAPQTVDLDRQEGDLIPRLDLVHSGLTIRGRYAEERNKCSQIMPEGLQSGGFDVGFQAALADDVAALKVILAIDQDDHAAEVQISQGRFLIVRTA